MNSTTLDNLKSWLHRYVNGYRKDDGSLTYLLQLKLDHSLRVAEDSRFIAEKLKWPEEDVNIAEAIGLMHDVGRFSQFVEFNTFHDPDSINHGKRGFEIAQTCDILDQLDDTTRQIILDSVHFHNCRHIPTGLSDESMKYLKLIRDADKIDIIYIVNHAIENDLHKKYPQIMLDIDLEGDITPALLQEIKDTETGTYKNVHSLADLNLMRLTWVSNVNYDPSCKLFANRKLMEDLIKCIPTNPEVREVTSMFIDKLNTRIATVG